METGNSFKQKFKDQYEDFLQEVKNLDTRIRYLSSIPPDDFFTYRNPSDLNENDIYPAHFYYGCNVLAPARQIEIFRYSYLNYLTRILRSIVQSFERLDIESLAFFVRSFLEVSAVFIEKVEEIETVTNDLKKYMGIPINDVFSTEVDEVLKAYKTLAVISTPTSLDWQKVKDFEDLEQSIEMDKKTKNILFYLKKISKRLSTPYFHRLYCGCSEIIHPNSLISFTSHLFKGSERMNDFQENELERPNLKVYNYKFNDHERNKIWAPHYFNRLIYRDSIKVFKELGPEFLNKSKRIEKLLGVALKVCRPIARRVFKTKLSSKWDKASFNGLSCPCGSKKKFLVCCAKDL